MAKLALTSAIALALLFALPTAARAEEAPPEPQEEAEQEGVSPIVFGASGAAVFGAGYVATIVVGAIAASDAETGGGAIAGHACIPIAGPLIILGDDEVSDGFDSILVITAAAQGVGLVSGFAAVSYAGSTQGAKMAVAPTPGGVVVTGRF